MDLVGSHIQAAQAPDVSHLEVTEGVGQAASLGSPVAGVSDGGMEDPIDHLPDQDTATRYLRGEGGTYRVDKWVAENRGDPLSAHDAQKEAYKGRPGT